MAIGQRYASGGLPTAKRATSPKHRIALNLGDFGPWDTQLPPKLVFGVRFFRVQDK